MVPRKPPDSAIHSNTPEGRSRRAVLGLLAGGATALAGCLDRAGAGTTPSDSPSPTPTGTPDDTTPTPSPTPSPTAEPSQDVTLDVGQPYEGPDGVTETVEAVRVEKLIRTATLSGVHVDVGWFENEQFAVVEVAEDATREFTLYLDGRAYNGEKQLTYRATPPGSHGFTGNPAMRVPVGSYDEGAVVWERPNGTTVEWRLATDTLSTFATQPAFEIRSFEAPTSVSKGEAFYASFTVANTGERDGRFIAEFGAGPISDHGEVVLEVPAGETRSKRAPMEPYYSEDAESVDVVLDWGKERLKRTVQVEN